MDKASLIKKMKEFMPIKESKLEELSVNIGDMTFANLRDNLIGLGKILDEDFDINSYVIIVPAGLANQNNAIVAIEHETGKLLILAYAKEGIINQHTASKAIEKVLKKLNIS